MIADGKLEVRWTFAPSRHREATVQRVAEDFLSCLRQIIAQSALPDSNALTPSDFPLAKLNQDALSQLFARYGKVEDIFAVTPVQGLFQTLASSGKDVGFDQYHYVVRGPLDVSAFRTAWERVLKRHAILRTAFISEGVNPPVQLVQREVALAWEEEDWRSVPASEHATRREEFLKADRARGFDLTKPPLMRCTLVRLGEQDYWLVWSHHHLQVDGWSWPLIFRDVAHGYAGRDLAAERTRPFRDYVSWLDERCSACDEQFWRENLRGFKEPTPVPGGTIHGAADYAEHSLTLSAVEASELVQFARSNQMPLNTLAQAAWAAVLSRHSGRSDVVIGAAFSGRPADLAGVESIVGSFINNLPVRLPIVPAVTVATLLQQAQTSLTALNEHQFTAPAKVQEWSEVPWRFRLFESLVVFQNYVVDEAAWRLGMAQIENFVAPIRTNFPLTLVVQPGTEFKLTLVYCARQLKPAQATDLLSDVAAVLRGCLRKPAQSVGELLATLSPPMARDIVEPTRLQGTSQNYLAPQTELEKQIAGIWQQAFGLDRVGTADNFFDLGGHSLLMIQVHAQLCIALQREISIVRMFQYPTVGSLAKFLGLAPGAQTFEKVQNRAQQQRAALSRHRVVAKRNT